MTTDNKTRKKGSRKSAEKLIVGWQEWAGLPELGIDAIKAKIDTGARTSALHAFKVTEVEVDGEKYVRFSVHPVQRHKRPELLCQAKLKGKRKVRSSNGQQEERFFIETKLKVGRKSWKVELTLTNRDEMGFRMLIGRQALKRKALVDPAKSFLASPRQEKPS